MNNNNKNSNSNNNNNNISRSSSYKDDDDDEGLYEGPINEEEKKDIENKQRHYNNNRRRNSRDRNRSYSRSRSRSRSNSRDGPNRYNNRSRGSGSHSRSRSRSRSYSRSRSRSDSRERYNRRRDYNRRRNYNKSSSSSSRGDEPTNILMIKGLNNSITEERLSDFMKIYGAFESLSIKYDKNGETRGFAFVNYKTVEEASTILRSTGGTLSIDGTRIYLSYGIPEVIYDWICETCNNSNYSWRPSCHKCQSSITREPRWVLSQPHQTQQHQENFIPSNTLIIRDLSLYATDETLALSFSQFSRKPKRVSVSKKRNNCIGFVEYYAINDAIEVFAQCHKKPLYICDGLVGSISYAKNNYENSSKKEILDPNTGLTKSDMDQWLNNYGVSNIPSGFNYHAASGYYYNPETSYFYDHGSGVYFYYDNNSQGYYYYDSTTNSYLPFVPKPNDKPIDQSSITTTTPTTAPTATATTSTSSTTTTTTSATTAKTDSTTNDQNTKQEDKRKVVSHVPKFNSFLKKKNNTEIEKWKLKASITEKEIENETKHQKEQELLEQQLEQQQLEQHQLEQKTQQIKLDKDEYDPSAPDITSTTPTLTSTMATAISTAKPSIGSFSIGSAGGIKFSKPATSAIKVVSPVIIKKQSMFSNDDEDDENQNNSNQSLQDQSTILQKQQIICKICDRMFISDEALFKHEKESKLHQSNLEKLKPKSSSFSTSSSSLSSSSSSSSNNSYGSGFGNNNNFSNDSSGFGSNSESNKRKQDSTFGENSIGVKLLKKTGWKQGEGLGKNSDGMTSTIQVTMKTERSGLGSQSNIDPRFVIQPGDDYQTRLKKKNFQRFLSENGGNGLNESNPFFK
ncbi:hypothetical protein RB653_007334 [Dictyostelium firmibasis]|uniref:RNA-binding region RNP-1 domain-containing protein n=1 Tax=Dictyostelium firmibasis TaxID=79012 RepID=A0AAN7TV76_9MYCE